jgi:hypothetical protein
MRQSRLQNLYHSAVDKSTMVFVLWQLKKGVRGIGNEPHHIGEKRISNKEESRRRDL